MTAAEAVRAAVLHAHGQAPAVEDRPAPRAAAGQVLDEYEKVRALTEQAEEAVEETWLIHRMGTGRGAKTTRSR